MNTERKRVPRRITIQQLNKGYHNCWPSDLTDIMKMYLLEILKITKIMKNEWMKRKNRRKNYMYD